MNHDRFREKFEHRMWNFGCGAGVAGAGTGSAPAGGHTHESFPKKSYSPHAGRNFPTRVFFGDTHVHTGASMDAGAFGARLGPEDAFRFASGEEVTAANGMRVKLVAAARFPRGRRSLRQHGLLSRSCSPAIPRILADPTGKRWYDDDPERRRGRRKVAMEVIDSFSKGTFPQALASLPGTATYRAAWDTTSRPPRSTTSPATSRHSSATSGPRTPAATTCIAS